MQYTQNAINILTAKSYNGIGRSWIVRNLKGNESSQEIVTILNKSSRQDQEITLNEFEKRKRETTNCIDALSEFCDGLIAMGDTNFPKYRGIVKESERPIYLFYKGDLRLLNFENVNITVIGLLNPESTIEAREKRMVAEIVSKGVTVISGLAFGCDSIAHKQALLGGKTVAILPSPLNKILPAKNKNLAAQIVVYGGLLISEYFDDFRSSSELSARYKERDRLQALFCDTIILAASYAKDSASRWNIRNQKLDSGARLAMEYAKEYQIKRAVMYDHITDSNNPMFDLNRQLIAEQSDIEILTPKTLEVLIEKIKRTKSTGNMNLNKPADLFG